MTNVNERKENIVKFNHWVDNHKYAPFNVNLKYFMHVSFPLSSMVLKHGGS